MSEIISTNNDRLEHLVKIKKSYFGQTAKLAISFVAGMVLSAALIATYTLIYLHIENPPIVQSAIKTSTPTTTTTKADEGSTSVTQANLDKYVSAVDCSTLPTYSNYQLSASTTRQNLVNINLDEGTLTYESNRGGGSPSWGPTLPIVVDANCNVISITKLSSGDIINLYYYLTPPSPGATNYIRIVQLIQ